MKAIVSFSSYSNQSIATVVSVGQDESDARRNATLHFDNLANKRSFEFIEDMEQVPEYQQGAAIDYVPFDFTTVTASLWKEEHLETDMLSIAYSVTSRSVHWPVGGCVIETPQFELQYRAVYKNNGGVVLSSEPVHASIIDETLTQNDVLRVLISVVSTLEAEHLKSMRKLELEKQLGYISELYLE